jgi:5-methylcytosine-specific restriction endonuclease McrA
MPTRPPVFRPLGWKPQPSKRKEVIDAYYRTAQWQRLRAYVVKRDGYRCTQTDCPTPDRGYGGRLVAGHIVPRSKGGADHPSNVRTFCSFCDGRWHSEKGAWSRQ